MTKVTKRTTRILIERAAVAQDDYGEEIPTWSQIARPWAAMFYGTGQERRQAAAEAGLQSITLNVLASALTRSVTLKDRIVVGAETWDIVGISPIGRREIDFTAVRSQ